MLKPGGDKRVPSAVPSKKLHSGNTATASLSDSSVNNCTGGSLEVVSLERFQQQLEAMTSLSSSNDFTHTERHMVRGDSCTWQHSSQRTVRNSRGKRNAPIVVCLRESIRAFGRSSKSRPVSATSRRTLSESNASEMVVKLAPFGTSHGKKATKNFNAFLSAVEKVHTKDGKYALCSQNINQSTSTHSERQQLNNSVEYQQTADTQFDLSRLLSCRDNVELIHNDLRSVVPDVGTASDDQSDKSEDSCSSHLSTTESDTEPADESLTNRKDGECCDVSPQHCPQCLAGYYAYTHYYALGSKYFKIEVVEDDETNSDGYSQQVRTEPNSPTWMNSSSTETLLQHRHIDVVSLDLTGSDVTFTIEQHPTDSSSPEGATLSSSPEFIHNFYCTMFGFVPCLPGYCFVPAFYFTFPMWSVPKPLSSMSKKASSTPSQQRRHSSSQHGERLCPCWYNLINILYIYLADFSCCVLILLVGC